MNSYLYDAEIVPRAVTVITVDDRFADTSVWVLGQRRWIHLKRRVSTEEQRTTLQTRVRDIDDVEGVVNELMVGTNAPPPYAVQAAPQK